MGDYLRNCVELSGFIQSLYKSGRKPHFLRAERRQVEYTGLARISWGCSLR